MDMDADVVADPGPVMGASSKRAALDGPAPRASSPRLSTPPCCCCCCCCFALAACACVCGGG